MGNLRAGQKYTPDGNHRLIIAVTFSQVKGLLKFPAYFQLIAATNPCPCGWRNDAQKACGRAPAVVTKYAGTSILDSGKSGGRGTLQKVGKWSSMI